MIDLHIHSFFSDGQLCISEIARRAEEKGYKAIAVTDHADRSNIDFIIESLVPAAKELNEYTDLLKNVLGNLSRQAEQAGMTVEAPITECENYMKVTKKG